MCSSTEFYQASITHGSTSAAFGGATQELGRKVCGFTADGYPFFLVDAATIDCEAIAESKLPVPSGYTPHGIPYYTAALLYDFILNSNSMSTSIADATMDPWANKTLCRLPVLKNLRLQEESRDTRLCTEDLRTVSLYSLKWIPHDGLVTQTPPLAKLDEMVSIILMC